MPEYNDDCGYSMLIFVNKTGIESDRFMPI